MTHAFYDQLAPLYHLVYQAWHASVRQQGEQLAALITREWPGSRSVLDGLACALSFTRSQGRRSAGPGRRGLGST